MLTRKHRSTLTRSTESMSNKENTRWGWILESRSPLPAGFTLLELILVLVIMGLLTALVTPAITSLTGLKLKTAARKVAAGLRYARSQAVATGSEYQVGFNLEKGEMTIECIEEEEPYPGRSSEQEEYSGREGKGRVEEEGETEEAPKKKTYRLPKEITLAKVILDDEEITKSDDEEDVRIDFYPNGSCSGGEIILADEQERSYRVALNFITGIVEITKEEEI